MIFTGRYGRCVVKHCECECHRRGLRGESWSGCAHIEAPLKNTSVHHSVDAALMFALHTIVAAALVALVALFVFVLHCSVSEINW